MAILKGNLQNENALLGPRAIFHGHTLNGKALAHVLSLFNRKPGLLHGGGWYQ